MLEWLKSIDTQVFLAINGAHDLVIDFIMYWASNKMIWIPFYILLAYLLIRDYGRRGWMLLLLGGVAILVSDQTCTHLFKDVFQRLRPCHDPALEGMVHLVKGKCGGSYGFISSHASNSFALATYLSFLMGKKYRYLPVIMFAWALLLCYSRVYLGVHYPGDVIVGAIWGAGIGAAVFIIIAKIVFKDRTRINADTADLHG
jgi:undecaprenyl-diphosphatase